MHSISYLRRGKPGILATIALDGDMDVSKKSSKNKIAACCYKGYGRAVVTEETEFEFKSKNEGEMHAWARRTRDNVIRGSETD